MSLSPSRKSAPPPCSGSSAARKVRAPPTPRAQDFGVGTQRPDPGPMCCAGVAGAAGDARGGGGGAGGTPKDGAGAVEHPVLAAPSPNHHSLEVQPACPRILIKVLCRSAHFQPISHEEACWFRWCMESSAPVPLPWPGPLEP